MLFRNLKTGNLIEAQEPSTISLLSRSDMYEAVKKAAPVLPEPAVSVKTPAKRRSGKKAAQ